jgi:hypothetical protein
MVVAVGPAAGLLMPPIRLATIFPIAMEMALVIAVTAYIDPD